MTTYSKAPDVPAFDELGLQEIRLEGLRNFFAKMAKKRTAMLGFCFVAVAVATAVFGRMAAPYDKDQAFSVPNPDYDINCLRPECFAESNPARLAAPSWKHPLGTDQQSRDLLTRVMHGARPSLQVGIFAALVSTLCGSILGIVSGFSRGWVDLVLQRFVDALQSIPSIILLLLIIQAGKPSLNLVILALGILGLSSATRIVRSAVLTVASETYVESARSLGASNLRLMTRHILPNVSSVVIVVFSISIGANILAEASLSFLGLNPPGPSWGRMLTEGRPFLQEKPLLSLVGGGAITLTVLGFNLLGDGLRDVLDPRQRGAGGTFR